MALAVQEARLEAVTVLQAAGADVVNPKVCGLMHTLLGPKHVRIPSGTHRTYVLQITWTWGMLSTHALLSYVARCTMHAAS